MILIGIDIDRYTLPSSAEPHESAAMYDVHVSVTVSTQNGGKEIQRLVQGKSQSCPSANASILSHPDVAGLHIWVNDPATRYTLYSTSENGPATKTALISGGGVQFLDEFHWSRPALGDRNLSRPEVGNTVRVRSAPGPVIAVSSRACSPSLSPSPSAYRPSPPPHPLSRRRRGSSL